jgi:hypothetical protein
MSGEYERFDGKPLDGNDAQEILKIVFEWFEEKGRLERGLPSYPVDLEHRLRLAGYGPVEPK